jgi:hypothetical protein
VTTITPANTPRKERRVITAFSLYLPDKFVARRRSMVVELTHRGYQGQCIFGSVRGIKMVPKVGKPYVKA